MVGFETYILNDVAHGRIFYAVNGVEVDSVAVDVATLVNNIFVPVDISVTNGQLTVIHNGIIYFDRADLDGYDPLPDSVFVIGARTAGLTEEHRIDNLKITAVTGAGIETSENQAVAISGLEISDADAGSANVQATLGVTHGTLALAGTVGLAGDLDGSDGTLTLTGTIAAINLALQGLTYQPNAGNDTLSLTVNDLGHTGGGAQSATTTIAITVDSDNSAPVAGNDNVGVRADFLAIASTLTWNDNDPDGDSFAISGAKYNSDPAAYDDDGVYTIQGQYGTLYLFATAHASVNFGEFENFPVNAGDYIYDIGQGVAGDAIGGSAIYDLQPGNHLTDTFTYTITDSLGAVSQPATITVTFDPSYIDLDVRTSSGYDTTTLWSDLHNGTLTEIDATHLTIENNGKSIVVDAKDLAWTGSIAGDDVVLTSGLIKGFHVSDGLGPLLDVVRYSIPAATFDAAVQYPIGPGALDAVFAAYGYDSTGGSGADQLSGGNLDDFIDTGRGADIVYAGDGNDVITIRDNAAWNIDGGDGIDTIKVSGAFDLVGRPVGQNATNIEIFDLNKTGAVTFTIDPPDAATLNSGHVARILGNSGDTINLGNDFPAPNGVPGGHWVKTAGVMYPTPDGFAQDVTFDKYEYQDRGGTVQETLYIEQGVVVNHQLVANPDDLVVSSDAFEAPGTLGHPTASLGIDNGLLLANDYEEDVGQTSDVSGYSSQPAHGTLDGMSHIGTTFYDLNGGESLPGTGGLLSDVFSYIANDGRMDSNAAQVHLKIIGANADASHTLLGSTANEIFLGGQGQDKFVFAPGMGQDTIANFDNFYHSANDTIQLDGFNSVPTGPGGTFTDDELTVWKASGAIQASGNDVLILLDGSDTLLLTNTTIAHLHASDFIVHPL